MKSNYPIGLKKNLEAYILTLFSWTLKIMITFYHFDQGLLKFSQTYPTLLYI
jgi:hypothetical protein